jgi:aryl-alcohol dehydrogenase-like predicted oxidoreductase
MYSVPAREETYGSTERILGTWFKKQEEGEVVLASKLEVPNLIFYMQDTTDFSPINMR